ncbi:MAG: M15 family metallopeptidase [Pseudomonadota bacterium]
MADDAPQPDEAPQAAPAPQAEKPPTQDKVPAKSPTQDKVAEVPTQDKVPTQDEVVAGGGGNWPGERADWRVANVGSVWPGGPNAGLRRRFLVGVAFVAPSLVIVASIYFIVRGEDGRAQPQSGALSAQSAPSSSPSQFPGDAEEDAAELPEPTGDAGRSLEQPSQLVPEVSAAGPALPGFEDEMGDEEPAPSKPAPPKHFATVQDAASGSCSTESVDGLSRQIIDQARCIKPNEFVPLPKRANLVMAPNVYPYLELGARDHLLRALDAHKSATMTINSALRTVAQQYLVSHWSLSKICGVQLATRPGESNHEIGTALDIKEAAGWRPALEAQDFHWLGASDRVHFDYKPVSTSTHGATDVLAFQKLWNRNHKDDAISESGRFDPPTEQRLKKAPPSGFALGASCAKVSTRAR